MDDEAFADAVKETRRIVDKLNSEENLVLSETVQDDEETLQTEREYFFECIVFRWNFFAVCFASEAENFLVFRWKYSFFTKVDLR